MTKRGEQSTRKNGQKLKAVLHDYQRGKYTSVKIPKELAESIDRYVEASKLGYHSRTNFILEAIRLRLKP